MTDRIKLRDLAVEWGAEIGVDPMDLARALLSAAFAGEFDNIPPTKRVTAFDDRRLIHSPIVREPKDAVYVEMAIRAGWAWVHRDAVIVFASAEGREYSLPQRWRAPVLSLSTLKTDKPNAAAVALKNLYPRGRQHHAIKVMLACVSDALGEEISETTFRRAMTIAWPPNRAKNRQN